MKHLDVHLSDFEVISYLYIKYGSQDAKVDLGGEPCMES